MKRRLTMTFAGILISAGVLFGTAIPAEASRVIQTYSTEAECSYALWQWRSMFGLMAYCTYVPNSPSGSPYWVLWTSN
ncbi:hypothetical protein [Rhizohabitans arisaemae]|uniref:hypothetical protein n=1 Tax=Rhizohabitans arisaemae TaxID=2720610 RepID=UPI0024B0AE95|nr:hypothetical protein [Rhizohabitans arisaemae]